MVKSVILTLIIFSLLYSVTVAGDENLEAYDYMVCLKQQSKIYNYPQSAPIGWPDYKHRRPDCTKFNITLEDVRRSLEEKMRPYIAKVPEFQL